MAKEFNSYPSRIDTEELQRIKSNFKLGDNIRSLTYEQNKYNRANPQLIQKGLYTTETGVGEGTLFGLSYPLELNDNGGIKTASNFDRISQQIIEILDTRVGERVYRRFFGIPELIVETISESVLSQLIKKQILSALPFKLDMDVSVEIDEEGTAVVLIGYSLEGSEKYLIKYSVNNA